MKENLKLPVGIDDFKKSVRKIFIMLIKRN